MTSHEDIRSTHGKTQKREGKPNTCRHFHGVQHKVCDAGVNFEEVTRVKEEGNFGCWLRLPCTNATEETYPCHHLSRLTDEEVKQQEEETDKYLSEFVPKMFKAREAIVEHIGKERKKQFVKDHLLCPICNNGRLQYIYSGHYNGHIHAQCTTTGCVAWGE